MAGEGTQPGVGKEVTDVELTEQPGGHECTEQADDGTPEPEHTVAEERQPQQDAHRTQAGQEICCGTIRGMAAVSHPTMHADGHQADDDQHQDDPTHDRCNDVSQVPEEEGHEHLDGCHQDTQCGQQGKTTGLEGRERAGQISGRTAHEQGVTGPDAAYTQDLDQGHGPSSDAGGSGGEVDVLLGDTGLPAHDQWEQGDLAENQHDVLNTHHQREPQGGAFVDIIEDGVRLEAHWERISKEVV